MGVNSRDLDTFRIDVGGRLESCSRACPGAIVVAVAESGMRGPEDVERAAAAGADAVLIGTALSAAADPETSSGSSPRCRAVAARGQDLRADPPRGRGAAAAAAGRPTWASFLLEVPGG